jgi:F420 biosynthesis protein FbiB-like protein
VFTSFGELAGARKSIRRLRPEPVPRDVIEQGLRLATLAPSPHNAQPWRFAVVLDLDRKQRLADAMLSQWYDDLRRDGLDEATIRERTQRPYNRTVNAPAAILVSLVGEELDEYPDPLRQSAERAMAVQSVGAAIQNLLLGLAEQRVASSWICAPLFCGPTVRAALDLPEEWEPQALILCGYPAADPPPRPRKPLDGVTVWR